MDRKKWHGKDYPPSVWISKLTEEVGEVARIFSEPEEYRLTRKQRKHAIAELKHVEFIAKEFRSKLEVDLQMGARND